ncbi:MAG TPA: phospholipase D-like domain-containing protein [Vicinamibacterales bacterium]|nr:phospholipase D-like domain-containing protein [Vicinamibacterales bacterium]
MCLAAVPGTARAQVERLCDPAFEDCRQILINYIRAERVGLDVAFWFMEDSWIASEIINRFKAGVPVRVLMDTEANASTPRNADRLAELKAAGIPMREKVSNGILHWKMMLFAGQGIVEFSGANFSSDAWVYTTPYSNYVDEAIYFTGDPKVVNSFRTKFDDLWTDTSRYADYANVTTRLRHYDRYAIDPELNFAPYESFANRSVERYNAETQKLDVIIYRITDQRHTNAVINARQRGVPVRIITEPQQYRDPKRLWHSWNIDRLYMAGVQIRNRVHAGLNHQKLALLYGQRMSVVGSSNWTSPSSDSQEEHNYFTTKSWMFTWLVDHFERKWNNSTGVAETGPFTPLPPDAAATPTPAPGATGVSTSGATLRWHAGYWAHVYDIYFGTTPNPPLLAANQNLGPSQSTVDLKQYTVPFTLEPGTTYYWRIVSKTMANLTATSQVWSFTTAGTPTSSPPSSSSIPAPWSSQDIGAVGVAGSASLSGSTFTVKASGADIWGTADGLHYVYQPVSGDVDVVARVSSVEYVHAWTKAGVMIRNALTANSSHALMLVSPARGLAFQRRTATGGDTTSTAGSSGTAPAWVKLERRGSTVRAYQSSNGTSWSLVGSDSIGLGSTVYVGLALTSHDNTRLAAATFDGVSVTGVSTIGDTQAPTVSITSPASGATVSGTTNVAVNASDNVAVARVDMLLNGSLVATDVTAPYQFAWDTTAVANGSHTLQARAVDTSNNTALSAAVTVTVSNTTSTAQEIVLWAADATRTSGGWRLAADVTAAAGLRMHHPDAGAAKLNAPLASPTDYFELTFSAEAGKAYRLWIRGKADNNHWANDSVFVQFSNSVDASGSSIWRIGTTSAAEVNLEECSGCGLAGWGWQDNGWGSGVLGPLVYFRKSGTQTIRIQTREDGFSIDQIVLSPSAYLHTAPGANKNDTRILGKTQ